MRRLAQLVPKGHACFRVPNTIVACHLSIKASRPRGELLRAQHGDAIALATVEFIHYLARFSAMQHLFSPSTLGASLVQRSGQLQSIVTPADFRRRGCVPECDAGLAASGDGARPSAFVTPKPSACCAPWCVFKVLVSVKQSRRLTRRVAVSHAMEATTLLSAGAEDLLLLLQQAQAVVEHERNAGRNNEATEELEALTLEVKSERKDVHVRGLARALAQVLQSRIERGAPRLACLGPTVAIALGGGVQWAQVRASSVRAPLCGSCEASRLQSWNPLLREQSSFRVDIPICIGKWQSKHHASRCPLGRIPCDSSCNVLYRLTSELGCHAPGANLASLALEPMHLQTGERETAQTYLWGAKMRGRASGSTES
eukprot:3938766-Pleurochrysis_carterae.AAC.1